ncbi:hypothetical protein PEL8287_03274 [Roseovarius litorisediminis]|uniref:DUF2270 domain-containing protein n=1 Tax=Roseovarius litorisediminis TaxID=1312363 RepID=A0A1Y5TBI1_9RHOB|nr:DUF2270 domain-containing protein [Roseovarius litorisediminis]SLN60303.1 hypothetical protein PEL8287_03274 [Roseovarius litorisediminis]
MTGKRKASEQDEFSAAEIGALAHLYRGEVYRSTIWRTRLDTTTNWAVVTLGVALSITFSSPSASPLPLLLVGILILLFLALEARRYRFFNVWRGRTRWMEKYFYVPMLQDGDLHTEENWQSVLAMDYKYPQYHVSYLTALSRRIRSNYLWILLIQALAYLGKLMVHPTGVASLEELRTRADIGPVPGELVLGIGVIYIGVMISLSIWVTRNDKKNAARRGGERSMG